MKTQPARESNPPRKVPRRTDAEQRAEIERVAKEHGADLSEVGFNEVLKKIGRSHAGRVTARLVLFPKLQM